MSEEEEVKKILERAKEQIKLENRTGVLRGDLERSVLQDEKELILTQIYK